jgi:phosphoserine phosphatase
VTGRLLGPVRSPAGKLALLRQLTRVYRLPSSATLAAGDGANDLPMLHAAGLGVAFRPSPAVADVAPVIIRWGDLTAPPCQREPLRASLSGMAGPDPQAG